MSLPRIAPLLALSSVIALSGCDNVAAPDTHRNLAPGAPGHSFSTGPVLQDPASGHYYQLVATGPIDWHQANDAANASHYGACVSSHLATITSAEEDLFIGNLGNGGGWWVGGYKPNHDADPMTGWTWINGDPFYSYMSWRGGEPNNSGGNEFAIYVNISPAGAVMVDYKEYNNDLDGYIVEFEGCNNTPPTVSVSGPAQAVINSQVTFTAAASDADGDALTYSWSVDGVAASGTAASFTQTFTTAGLHTVDVTVNDGHGNSVTQSTQITLLTAQQVLAQTVATLTQTLIGALTPAQAVGLASVINNAAAALQRGSPAQKAAAKAMLSFVVNTLNFLVVLPNSRLTAAQAKPIIDVLTAVIGTI